MIKGTELPCVFQYSCRNFLTQRRLSKPCADQLCFGLGQTRCPCRRDHICFRRRQPGLHKRFLDKIRIDRWRYLAMSSHQIIRNAGIEAVIPVPTFEMMPERQRRLTCCIRGIGGDLCRLPQIFENIGLHLVDFGLNLIPVSMAPGAAQQPPQCIDKPGNGFQCCRCPAGGAGNIHRFDKRRVIGRFKLAISEAQAIK